MAAAIERYLKDFGRPDEGLMVVEAVPGAALPAETLPAVSVEPDQPAPDIEAERAEAFEQGHLMASRELTATHQTALEQERSRHLEEINQLFVGLEQEFSATLVTRFEEMKTQLVEAVGDQVARILVPVLEATLRDRMVGDLADVISKALADSSCVKVAVSGSPTMKEALVAAMGAQAEQLDFTVDDALDLTVHLDGAVLGTRLAEWSASVRELVA